jgi:hypothetical protein
LVNAIEEYLSEGLTAFIAGLTVGESELKANYAALGCDPEWGSQSHIENLFASYLSAE